MIWTALMRSPNPTIDTEFRNTCGQHIKEMAYGFGRVDGDVPQANSASVDGAYSMLVRLHLVQYMLRCDALSCYQARRSGCH